MNKAEVINYLNAPVSRNITDIIVHCTATRPGQIVNVDIIDSWHKARGFKKQPESGRYCGYHFVVLENGDILPGRTLNEVGAHVAGQNSKSIGVCYVGGLDQSGKGSDTRTKEQKDSLVFLLSQLVCKFQYARIQGHRDYSPDINGNGVVDPWEYLKECPCFDAKKEYEWI